ncbi:class I SAM-dependent methyltransferase [Dongia rigui]|uniref:Class I SAM-dependent methyltransferase n=1 Tax=Dongia rigui TaxID=940149 RepID=A0ABU5DVX4_9PROT|nr:class I SAM-dependent methyltransferase [Dongia rigui]MDY0870858.1 class I SAM-dependent methyltransferase [Dongia rigui]
MLVSHALNGQQVIAMLGTDKLFAGSVPENYDRYMVPLIFQPFAADLAERAAALSPKAVLETAVGTGVVTRALAPKLSPDATYVATDLNPPMLDYAASQQPPGSHITWQQANALELPFADATFDLVCCQFGAMFFPDRVAAYREARRVLKPGGHFLFNVWDRIEENIFANDVTKALAEMFPNDPPRFLARTPHGYHDTLLIRRELEAAGFSRVTIETRAEQSRAPSARLAALAYCHGTPLRNEIEARDAGKLEAATDHAASALAAKHGNGVVVAKIQAHVIVATA